MMNDMDYATHMFSLVLIVGNSFFLFLLLFDLVETYLLLAFHVI
jgi:hypothetical protein